jgi:hypothetical protein
VHHLIYRIDIDNDCKRFSASKVASILDEVHIGSNWSEQDKVSFKIKQIKQQALISILDKFQVG